MAKPWDAVVRERLIEAQTNLASALRAECERGEMTEEQLDFILDLFANLDDYGEDEALAQLQAWLEWRNGG